MAAQLVVGLEIHAQLRTQSKLFCACRAAHGGRPNSRVCPYCSGQPGTLPVLNTVALDRALLVATALGCQITSELSFDRKHYFYPDLPKGYQITQYARPLGRDGILEYPLDSGTIHHRAPAPHPPDLPAQEDRAPSLAPPSARSRSLPPAAGRIAIERVHLEEDAGKTVHDSDRGLVRVDLNRAGIALVEIVTRPELSVPEEAGAVLRELRRILRFTHTSEAEMENGSLRCDVNVSLRPSDRHRPGTKVEIKNLNSIRAVVESLHHEAARQRDRLAHGRAIAAETRSWDPDRRETVPLRLKEGVADYRYLPEPDLPPGRLSAARRTRIRNLLPELPFTRARRMARTHRLPWPAVQTVFADPDLADLFAACLTAGMPAGRAVNWLRTQVLGVASARRTSIAALGLQAEALARLDAMVARGALSLQAAQALLPDVIDTGESPEVLARDRHLLQINTSDALRALVLEVLAREPRIVATYRAGKSAAINALIGKVMARSKGRANPQTVRRLLSEELDGA